ncbi:hypothetical protein KEM54_001476 [Ascosphaera aggregata]|nr:hypothetical protein KEM54_001476 [Ascosphaera aggregata]
MRPATNSSEEQQQQKKTQSTRAISGRIHSSASGLLSTAFNASTSGAGSALSSTVEFASGLACLLGEKGGPGSRSSAGRYPSSSSTFQDDSGIAKGLRFPAASATAATAAAASSSSSSSPSWNPQSDSFREHTRATIDDAELNGFLQPDRLQETSQEGAWERQWNSHQEQKDKGKGKQREIAGEDVQADVNNPHHHGGLPEAFEVQASNAGIGALEQLWYEQQPLGASLQDLELDHQVEVSSMDNYDNSRVEKIPAFLEAQAQEDRLEEIWREMYRQERDSQKINDCDGSIEPEYDLSKLEGSAHVPATKEDVLRDDDGAGVLTLLDDPGQALAGALEMEDSDIGSDGYDFSVGSVKTTNTESSSRFISPSASKKPDAMSLLPGVESLISYAELTSSDPHLIEWTAMPSVSDWLEADSKYIDEVWGGALKPFVEAAKEETSERKKKGLEGVGDGPAVRRLGMLLSHINGPGSGPAPRPALAPAPGPSIVGKVSSAVSGR